MLDMERAESRPEVPVPHGYSEPVQGLRRCYRCGTLTQPGVPVRDIESDYPDGMRLYACLDCVTPAEREFAARLPAPGGVVGEAR
ncbi:hypothetical protein SAMN05421773_102230 [Streptomyces aidingensis]|uniref:Uncharacterized protein n=2 Tax=Streptomyces aidingensis TaxID=910347 RepID=A0A1I1H2I3_9ACTN|nr:hypothetical protein SAMN05421773_102230 [Streptomyces aidingensis]